LTLISNSVAGLRSAMSSRSRGRPATAHSVDSDVEPTFRFRVPDRVRDPTLIDDEAVIGDDNESELDEPTELADVTFASEVPQIGDLLDEPSGIHRDIVADDEEGDSTILARLRQDSVEMQIRPAPPGKGSKTSMRERPIREMKVSKHGVPYPSLPPTTVKRLASSFLRQRGLNGKINQETLQAISSATDWFFEQASQDLGAYAQHAGRKRIEEADVVTLMKRQKVVGDKDTVFSLAQKLLPRELLQEVRMPPPSTKGRLGKRKRLETIAEEEED
jgi:histone H3/H4